MLEIRTLGGLSLSVNGQIIKNIGSRKAEALLVYLAVGKKQQNRDVLSALFWPESSQEQASTSLRVVLSILRKSLGAYLEISRNSIKIDPDAKVYLDLADLEMKLAGDHIEQALDIYQGDFLAGFNIHDSPEFENWVRCEQDRVRKLVVGSLHGLILEALEDGNYSNGQTYARRLIEIDPLDEPALQKYMLALVLDGQRITALAEYQKYMVLLHDELGTVPSQKTREMFKQISCGEKPISLDTVLPAHDLPVPQTSFIGREVELSKIKNSLKKSTCRLLTITGPGGCGKTRLALKTAAKSRHSFNEGTCFVPLESCYSTDFLIPSIANALHFDIDTFGLDLDPKNKLLDYLRNRSILIVLDGFERLVEGAGLLSEILEHAPKVKLLVTSRQRLNLQCEWLFPLEGLPYPKMNEGFSLDVTDALSLFAERAHLVNAEFHLNQENYQPSLNICQLVEGMPLGIELAAAWTSMLSSLEIANEMQKNLDFLNNNMGDIPEKHRRPRAVFESSLQLLKEEQRQVFYKLSIFRGGFTRQAALQVAGVSLQQLSALVDRSLLKRTTSGYFSMHNLLQQFAFEKLCQFNGVHEEVSEKLSQYYIHLLIEHETDFMGPEMLQARDEIRQELDNVRAAVDWACLHWEEQSILRTLIALESFYIVQGWHEGVDVFRNIAQLRKKEFAAKDTPLSTKDLVYLSARIHQAFFHSNLGQIDESEAISKESLDALEDLDSREELSECLHNLGVNASFRGEYETAMDLLEKAILLGRECDHIIWPSYLLWLGHVYFLLGEYEQGLLSLNKSYEIFNRRGTLWGTAFALSKMGLAADGLENHSQAMQYHRDALEIFNRFENLAGKGYSQSRMSVSAFFMEDYVLAEKYGLEGYQTFVEIGHRWGMCISLCRLGFAFIGLGETKKARIYLQDALKRAKQDDMLPLSLYALAGLACVLAQRGEDQESLNLFHYVQIHPKTPILYLKQASQWLFRHDKTLFKRINSTTRSGDDLKLIDNIIEKILKD